MDQLINALRHRFPIVSLAAELLFQLFRLVDETHLVILVVFAALATQVRNAMMQRREDYESARFLSLAFGLAYAAHLWPNLDLTADVVGVLLAALRTVVAATIVHQAISVPIVVVGLLVVRYFKSGWLSTHEWSESLLKQNEERWAEIVKRQQRVEPQRPREEILRQQIDQCRIDYEYECDILRGAGLEEDELEAALESAKQKYLQRLHHALH
ncbi:MAG: hypothetical protein KDA93_12485 [Planctomycetaceae bacterium]|nr:hypothetical protein [Planctomycetaceae bacterium]